MIVLRTPKGWTSPAEVGGHKLEGSWRAHQVPMADVKKDPERLKQLEDWLRSYKPEELFDDAGPAPPGAEGPGPDGHPADRVQPARQRRAPQEGPADARLPRLRRSRSTSRATAEAENCRPLGVFLRDVMKQNMNNFRVFGPDENTSNKLNAIYEVSKKLWLEEYFPEDADGTELAPDGRVIEMLSEHTLEGMLEGLPADRPARVLQHLRGVRPRHRLDVQPARQVADHLQPAAVAGARSRR